MDDEGWSEKTSEYPYRSGGSRRGSYSSRPKFTRCNSDGYPKKNITSDSNVDTESDIYPVPGRCIGRVIGRGGSRIKEIQESSGTRISVIIEIANFK